MSARARRLGWVPPFAVGVSAAVAGELAVGLLLYTTPGFVRALTLILAVLLGALALGLWTAPGARSSATALTESLRRRWLLALISFAGASAMAVGWTLRGGLSEQGVMRGLGLALLAAFPLYACGALLGAMAAGRAYRGRRAFVGASAAAGATMGTLLSGWVLVGFLVPVSMYALCLVLLSGGALVHGWLIADEGERRTIWSVPSRYGAVAVHEWSWGKGRRERVLTENGRVRAAEDMSGRPTRPWEIAATELVLSRPHAPDAHPRLRVLGAGGLTLPRRVLLASPEWRVEAVERNAEVLSAAETELGSEAETPGLAVQLADPLGAPQAEGAFAAVVVDAAALWPGDLVPGLDAEGWRSLANSLEPDGWLIVGGVDPAAAPGAPLDALLEGALGPFAAVALYREVDPPPEEERRPALGPTELLLVLSPEADARFPTTLGGLALEATHRAQRPEAADEAPLEPSEPEPAGPEEPADLWSAS